MPPSYDGPAGKMGPGFSTPCFAWLSSARGTSPPIERTVLLCVRRRAAHRQVPLERLENHPVQRALLAGARWGSARTTRAARATSMTPTAMPCPRQRVGGGCLRLRSHAVTTGKPQETDRADSRSPPGPAASDARRCARGARVLRTRRRGSPPYLIPYLQSRHAHADDRSDHDRSAEISRGAERRKAPGSARPRWSKVVQERTLVPVQLAAGRMRGLGTLHTRHTLG